MGEYVSNVANGIDTYSIRGPLGVCAGICPFNFPAMILLWVSLSLGFSNSFILAFAWTMMNLYYVGAIETVVRLSSFCNLSSLRLWENIGQSNFTCEFSHVWYLLKYSGDTVQMFPIAVTCGNTFVLKPSEKDPGKFYSWIVLAFIRWSCVILILWYSYWAVLF